ncbi:MAG: hypothetical protein ACOYU3_05420 [Bacillota bacterium]
MLKKAYCAVAHIIMSVVLLAGCGPNNNGTASTGQPPPSASAIVQGWGSELSELCQSITLPAGVLGDTSLEETGNMTTGAAAINQLKLYDYVQWLGSLEEKGWYLFGNEANKGATHIEMSYSTLDKALHVKVTLDKARGEWPAPVSAELDCMIPFYKYSEPVSATELQLADYDRAFKCTFKNATGEDVQKYMQELVNAGFNNKGQASGLYVLQKGLYEVNVFVDPDGVKPVEITLLKHTVQMVPLPPWPGELPSEYAAVLPLMGSPVKSIEQAVIGYKVEINDVSSYEVYQWYKALPGKGWGAINADGSAIHAQAGLALASVNFDSPSMIFGFTVEKKDSESTAAATATPAAAQTPRNSTGNTTATPSNNTSGHNTGDVTYTYKLTSGKYGAEDVEAGVKKEFGYKASLADWSNLKREYAGQADAFLTGLGVKHNEDIWVSRNYSPYYKGERHYFLAKIDGVKRDGFLIHDRWDGDTVWLGSWSGMKIRAIVLVPSQ